MKRYSYGFISPIFDSTSKIGYKSRFSIETLDSNVKELVLKNVVALGGITSDNVGMLNDISLYGVAILGNVWNTERKNRATLIQEYLTKVK